MRAFIVSLVIGCTALAPGNVWARQKPVSADVESKALREMAAAIPVGARVKAQTTDGDRINGTLMSTTDEGIVMKRRTRVPEPAITIRYDELARLELDRQDGMHPAKAIGIALAAGAGAVLTLLVIFASIGD